VLPALTFGPEPKFALHFSIPGAQVAARYYNFPRQTRTLDLNFSVCSSCS